MKRKSLARRTDQERSQLGRSFMQTPSTTGNRRKSCLILISLLWFLGACAPKNFATKTELEVAPDGTQVNGGSTTTGTTTTSGSTNTTSGTTSSTTSGTTTSSSVRDVVNTFNVDPGENQVDILLVLDDSGSMMADNQKLANRLTGFVQALQSSGIAWQMCVTTTRTVFYAGGSIWWYTSAANNTDIGGPVLRPTQPNLASVFAETIAEVNAGWPDSDDERGILAMNQHLAARSNNGCYRSRAALSVIVISDEDVRSVGGDVTQQFYANELKTLEAGDLPDTYIANVRAAFGASKPLTVNSIIVKPNDFTCMQTQDREGSKSHFGVRYAELSTKTGGFIGSICDTDYSTNLNFFRSRIVNSMSEATLECTPLGNVQVSIAPAIGSVQTSRDGLKLIFNPVIPEGRSVTLRYQCDNSRSPASVEGQTDADRAPWYLRFWTWLTSWF